MAQDKEQDKNPAPKRTDEGHSPEPAGVTKKDCSNNASNDCRCNMKFHWKTAYSAFVGVAALLGASTVLFVAAQWMRGEIDKSIDAKFRDESVLKQIAAQIRPALIFNENESITSDMGAAQYVKNITITKRGNDGWPLEFQIDFNRYFSNPPILTSLYDVASMIPNRGKGLSWNFQVLEVVDHTMTTKSNLWIYRLELTP